jgi:hypothetical protein
MFFNLGLDLISKIPQNTHDFVFLGWWGGYVAFVVLPLKYARPIDGKSQHKNTPENEQKPLCAYFKCDNTTISIRICRYWKITQMGKYALC